MTIMKRFFPRLTTLATATALAAAVCGAAACSSNDDSGNATTIDPTNGKVISDLDIGGDRTIDRGESERLSATVKYADGSETDVTGTSAVTWNVANTSVATVTQDGVVTAVGVGVTDIRATYQGILSDSRTIIVH